MLLQLAVGLVWRKDGTGRTCVYVRKHSDKHIRKCDYTAADTCCGSDHVGEEPVTLLPLSDVGLHGALKVLFSSVARVQDSKAFCLRLGDKVKCRHLRAGFEMRSFCCCGKTNEMPIDDKAGCGWHDYNEKTTRASSMRVQLTVGAARSTLSTQSKINTRTSITAIPPPKRRQANFISSAKNTSRSMVGASTGAETT